MGLYPSSGTKVFSYRDESGETEKQAENPCATYPQGFHSRKADTALFTKRAKFWDGFVRTLIDDQFVAHDHAAEFHFLTRGIEGVPKT